MYTEYCAWTIILTPLAIFLLIKGVGSYLTRTPITYLAIGGAGVSFAASSIIFFKVFVEHYQQHLQGPFWFSMGETLTFQLGLWIDPLSTTLMMVVSSISLMVHIYSVNYMREDQGYLNYFGYLSFFTFAMLALVSADNVMQLFFGWEAVGLSSYLLISFWFQKPEAQSAALKAFLINRAGDIGLLLGLCLLIAHTGSAQYTKIFEAIPALQSITTNYFGYSLTLTSLISSLLFISAMSKSAQIPLQIWLPDSMVGPTPVSALMHAATMVTAGVYLVARLFPIFEAAPLVQAFILIIGSSTALLFGIVSLVQTDIKRAIAFSTISQLGYMIAGLGVSAYAASILHLVTHAYFKALLFLAAGSIILTLNHEQALHKMGGLYKRLPITYCCFLIGSLALIGLPPFSGFYSKDLIISAVYESTLHHSSIVLYAFCSLLAALLVTALYTGRLIFMVFHGPAHYTSFSNNTDQYITIPLLLLSIPSIGLGWGLAHAFSGQWLSVLSSTFSTASTTLSHNPFIGWLSTAIGLGGVLCICTGYMIWPLILVKGPVWGSKVYKIVASQYGLEKLHQRAVIAIIQRVAKQIAMVDTLFIDKLLLQGSTQLVRWIAARLQPIQSGWLHQYLLIMIMSLILFIVGVIIRA